MNIQDNYLILDLTVLNIHFKIFNIHPLEKEVDKAQLSAIRNKKNQAMVAGSSGIHETPWIPALSHTGDSTCLSFRIKA